MEYDFRVIEEKWRKHWAENGTFQAKENTGKDKYYVLDMFPYPSGAGLHVGHPLGYIASDIYARYKRLQGFEVLHPMGYDSFGLPAEQYAIQTGQHPEKTTQSNIKRYREQLDLIGFSFDWEREVRTSDPTYYKWTQWIFTELFNSWYDESTQKARPISELIHIFEKDGNSGVFACCDECNPFTASDWTAYSESEKDDLLQKYRLAYLADSWVNWCPELGTVLANDEVVNGVSERGGHPVEQKLMRQWSMRIKAYANRLLEGLNTVDWSDSIKEMQRNWIGKSVGCSVHFQIENSEEQIEVFTTRPDTIFGATFLVLAPEHPLVEQLTTQEQKADVDAYVKASSMKSERDRQSNVKNISGVFTGSYVIHPFTQKRVPLWLGDYVLASYGTGAVMAVPCGDQRDWDFAKHFGLEIPNVFDGIDISEAAYAEKSGRIANSDFLNGLEVKDAIRTAIERIEADGIGRGKTNFRLRDAVFSRQRYWGEPFPVYYQDGRPKMIDLQHLPLVLPEVANYLPTSDGRPPLGNAEKWAWDSQKNEVVSNDLIDHEHVFPLELNTMPGWAGSSWYFLRYMDAQNDDVFADRNNIEFWKQVDLYIGGSEHATGHLLYARFWTKFLYDRGYIPFDEPFKKMINQGMILGKSAILYVDSGNNVYSYDVVQKLDDVSNLREVRVLIDLLGDQDDVDQDALRNWLPDFKDANFVCNEQGQLICKREVDKMSKRWFNVVTPDELCQKYGADTLRMYEMFLGPLEQSKPWDTKGINGVANFLRKLWRLFHFNDHNAPQITDENPDKEALKTLHKTIQKLSDDLNRFSFNTGVSNFMICVNELSEQKCHHRQILEPLVILISPYAPHIAEELWQRLGHEAGSVSKAALPKFNPDYLVDDAFSYPISFNGKVRFKLEFPRTMSPKEIEEQVLSNDQTAKWLDGKDPKKMIVVPGKIVNVVV
ncbi:MAG: leucine--tRNA ligase [Bacteroidetes bacterium]|nr:MAG: leucine--tRNA ligase [Bacteroidota bacterium]